MMKDVGGVKGGDDGERKVKSESGVEKGVPANGSGGTTTTTTTTTAGVAGTGNSSAGGAAAGGGSSGGDRTKRQKTDDGPQEGQTCLGCSATSTPEWRRGPLGPRTLCNACGLVYAKLIKKRFKEKIVNPNKKLSSGGGGGNKSSAGGGGNTANNGGSTSVGGAARGGNGGGMYAMAGDESMDELSDDDEYGSQDRNDMPD